MGAATELEVRGLDAFYGTSHILHHVDLEVPAGSAVVVLGRNGAGKTTLFRSIMNLGPTVKGSVRLFGKDVTGRPTYGLARAGVGFVPDDRRIYSGFDVVENLRLGNFAKGSRDVEPMTPEEVFAVFPLLERLAGRKGGQLSGGEQQLLAIARAMVARPKLMLLDEPSEGLAPVIVRSLLDAVLDLRERTGMTLLLAEQNVPFAMRVATDVYVVEEGEIVYQGTREAFEADPSIKERYLMV
ncbi:MAG: ATP-binding cassette domain-containing protein [Acidimicrobiia bacterium]|nr:ATP-binding cassette domain-containing protein [Acidimicrobiia bacterium]